MLMRIAIFVPKDVHYLELAGIMDVFAEANARINDVRYEVAIVVEDDRTIRCASGLRVVPDCAYDAYPGSPDTLLVAGSVGVPHPPGRKVVEWLAETAPQTRRYGSICTGDRYFLYKPGGHPLQYFPLARASDFSSRILT